MEVSHARTEQHAWNLPIGLTTFVCVWMAGLGEIVKHPPMLAHQTLVRTEQHASTSRHLIFVSVLLGGLARTVPLLLICVNPILVRMEQRVLTSPHRTLVSVQLDGLDRTVTHVSAQPHSLPSWIS